MFQLDVLNECALESTKQSRWKETTQRYLCNMVAKNLELQQDVLSGKYKVSPTVNFTLNERGHIRHIEAPVVRDRIVQKTLVKSVLAPALTKCLIYDNYASLPKRGTSLARKRFEINLRRYYQKHGRDGYIMLIDIKKYFDSIDHDVLKELITPYLDDQPEDVIRLVHYVIDTSSHTNKGLNLGSEAPQIFAIFYLNVVDTLVKVVKHVKYYGRYMDDIYVIGDSKEQLQALLTDIEKALASLCLEVNKKKTIITKLSHGFTYLQVRYTITTTGRIVKRPSRGKIIRERRRLKAFKRMLDAGRMTLEEIQDCYQSWRGTFVREHNSYHKTLKSMDELYKSLFPDIVERVKKRRSIMLDEAFTDARDLNHIINF